jgi:4-amino-4-deoxy-L-arabinose transferase-like glycosyltransferase
MIQAPSAPPGEPLTPPLTPDDARTLRLALTVIAAVTLFRLWFLGRSGLELYGDEAQYFAWSRDLAFGYFTKPPLIAWLIAATTSLYGTSEMAVRLAAPLCHALTAGILCATAWRLFDLRTGAVAAIVWILLPGVSFSSVIISTDAPLLLFASLWFFGYAGVLQSPRSLWAALWMGLGLGLGLLSKLAMAYVLAGLVVHLWVSPKARAILTQRGLWLGLGLGALIYSPNLIWNLTNGARTYGHLAENAGLGGALFNPANLGAFALSQAGLFGPICLGALIYATAKPTIRHIPSVTLGLCFAWPVLLALLAQSFLSRAFANWAAFAYVPACLVVAHLLVTRPKLDQVNLALHGLVAIGLYAWGLGLIEPPIKNDPVAGLHGWRRLGLEISRNWDVSEARVLIATDRMDMARLLYYLPLRYGPVKIVSSDGRAHSEFDVSAPLTIDDGKPGLLVSRFRDLGPLAKRFGQVTLYATVSVPRARATALTYYLFLVSDYLGPDGSAAEPSDDKQADKP